MDVVTKLMRLLANLCMDANIGQALVREDGSGALSVSAHPTIFVLNVTHKIASFCCLQVLSGLLCKLPRGPLIHAPHYRPTPQERDLDQEELALNVLAASSNLTFYYANMVGDESIL